MHLMMFLRCFQKEEAERRAKEEAELREKERAERAVKEEEERLERKKVPRALPEIMKLSVIYLHPKIYL